jgi:REP element-mobilizing transposase RayT
MPQSLSHILLHIIFATRNREPLLQDDYRAEIFRYIGGTLNRIQCPVLIIGGTADHIHALCHLSRNLAVRQVVESMKTESSQWIKQRFGELRGFYWQNGYAAFSVSESNRDPVYRYIETQETHHKQATFQDELRAFFEKHQVE